MDYGYDAKPTVRSVLVALRFNAYLREGVCGKCGAPLLSTRCATVLLGKRNFVRMFLCPRMDSNAWISVESQAVFDMLPDIVNILRCQLVVTSRKGIVKVGSKHGRRVEVLVVFFPRGH